MSELVSCYAVLVSRGRDREGVERWGEPASFFLDESNAQDLKSRLQATERIVMVQPFMLEVREEREKSIILADYGQ